MKKLMENWNSFLNEDRIRIFSTRLGFTLKKPEGAAAVIDDTLALIRGVPDVTVVNSDTDQRRSTSRTAYIELEFKFIPRSTSIEHDLKNIRKDIKGVSSLVLTVSPVRHMLRNLRRVQ